MADVTLSGPPPVRDYEQIEKQIDDALARLGAGEVLNRLFASGK